MDFPLALQPNCCSVVGQLVHKFADLPFLDERRDRSIIERVAAYAFNVFIVFPTLTVCALGEALGQLWSMPWVYLTHRRATRKLQVQECVHTIGTHLLFPFVVLGHAVLGRLAPANRIHDPDHEPPIADSIKRGDKHLAQYLLNHYLSEHRDPNTDETNPLRWFEWPLCVDPPSNSFSIERYEACRVLIPLLEKSSQKVKKHIFIDALFYRRDFCLLLLLWPLMDPEIQQEVVSLYHFCENILQRENPPRSIQSEDPIEMNTNIQILCKSSELRRHSFFRLPNECVETLWEPQRREIDTREINLFAPPKTVYLHITLLMCLSMYGLSQKTSGKKNPIQKKLEDLPTIPFPGVIAKMVVDYLPNYISPSAKKDHVLQSYRKDDLFYRWTPYRSCIGAQYRYATLPVHKYIVSIESKLSAVSRAIEKTLFSLHLKGYSSAKFLGSLTLGVYQTMEIWVLRPLVFCGVLLAVVANKVHQLFFSLAKAIRSPIDRRTNLKKSALAIPELVGSVCIIALQPLIAVWRALTMDMAQPIHRSLNLYMRCTYASKH